MQDAPKADWRIPYVCGLFSKFKTQFYFHIVLLKCPHVEIVFLKFTSCDNQALVGCIQIAAEIIKKLVSHLIRYIAITYWIFKNLRQF